MMTCTKRSQAENLLVSIADITAHRQALAAVFQRLQARFPHLQATTDNRFRLTDWTFEVQGIAADELEQIGALCQEWGWDFTYSNVQCHLMLRSQDKAAGLLQVLQTYPDYTPEQVVTVGDSPNDESMFDVSQFPLSVGVANVLEYRDRLAHQPTYVTTAAEGEGFCELARLLLASQ